MAALEELYAPDYVYHAGGFGEMDLAAWKQMALAWYTAFPDQHSTVEDLIAEGDKVVARCTVRATHQGEFMGVPATGKVVTNTGIEIHRIEDGKLVESWDSYDMLGFLQQLGAIPQMAQAGALPCSRRQRKTAKSTGAARAPLLAPARATGYPSRMRSRMAWVVCRPDRLCTRPLTDTVALITGASRGVGGAGNDVVVGNGRRMKREQQ